MTTKAKQFLESVSKIKITEAAPWKLETDGTTGKYLSLYDKNYANTFTVEKVAGKYNMYAVSTLDHSEEAQFIANSYKEFASKYDKEFGYNVAPTEDQWAQLN